METIDLKGNAQRGLEAFTVAYDAELAKQYFKEDYIQHNPGAPQGLAYSLQMIPMMKEAGTTTETHRIFQDGDIVVMHNSILNAAPFGGDSFVVFDVYRMEDGMVAEHWDALTPMVEPSFGNSQIDGATEVTDLDQTERNKALAQRAVTDLFVNGKVETASQYISEEQYIQHNPMFPDGFDAFVSAMETMKTQMPDFKYVKAHHVWGEGNFVLVAGEGNNNGTAMIIYDLFRFDDGKIVEHWDIIQPIPAEKANDNGVF
ncbi:MAG TPA: hypothetical protein DCE41_24265 [Cytophagales bacterium]|nr:hypothetical protein [Cytophagales bacterium]HAA23314.1 hypothetical protein [Cytophagales bacterium]HAP60397.1 hypothetical protein [Cytophagales bacterium]